MDFYAHTAARYAAAADLCDDVQYNVSYTADYNGDEISMAHAVTACDAEDAERMARRQCRKDGGSNIRNITARFFGRAK